MRISGSLFLIALGAILRFALNTSHHNTHGFNVGTIGVILMIVGGVGLVLSLIWTMTRRTTTVVAQAPVVAQPVGYADPNQPGGRAR